MFFCSQPQVGFRVHLLVRAHRQKVASGYYSKFGGESVEVVRTDRLVLRDLEEADWRPVHSYASDSEVVRYMNWGPNTEGEKANLQLRNPCSRR